MGRFFVFLLGVAVGAAGMFGGMNYHLVKASDGIHVVPKVTAELEDAYVDIREFDKEDWDEHRSLAIALVKAEKSDLIGDNFMYELQNSVNNVLEGLRARNE